MKAMAFSMLAIGLAGASASVALYEGLCIKTLKFPEEREVVRQAAEYVIATYPPAIVTQERSIGGGNTVSVREIPSHPIRYENVEEFLRKNPTCCELVERAGEGYKPSFLSRMIEKESRIVRLRFDVAYLADGRQRRVGVEKFVTVKRCGGAFNN